VSAIDFTLPIVIFFKMEVMNEKSESNDEVVVNLTGHAVIGFSSHIFEKIIN
jgi:hypothetical protein